MLKRILELFEELIIFIAPPGAWRIPVLLLLGILSGIGLFVIYISKASSYLSDKPETCINCHIMTPTYSSWIHSSHRRAASCNHCHVPQDNFIDHYIFKAKDGLRHAAIFTLRREPQVISIKESGKNAVQKNCSACHNKTVHRTSLNWMIKKETENKRYCWECHSYTPHGKIGSLSSVPYARAPLPGRITGDFDKILQDKDKSEQ